jgi:hypothetical protein
LAKVNRVEEDVFGAKFCIDDDSADPDVADLEGLLPTLDISIPSDLFLQGSIL